MLIQVTSLYRFLTSKIATSISNNCYQITVKESFINTQAFLVSPKDILDFQSDHSMQSSCILDYEDQALCMRRVFTHLLAIVLAGNTNLLHTL